MRLDFPHSWHGQAHLVQHAHLCSQGYGGDSHNKVHQVPLAGEDAAVATSVARRGLAPNVVVGHVPVPVTGEAVLHAPLFA